MTYSESFALLNRIFNQTDPEIAVDGLDMVIKNFTFHSHHTAVGTISNQNNTRLRSPFYTVTDDEIEVNNRFRYSVVLRKGDIKQHKRAILMLHGLNERKWNKYLPWAASLVEKTGVPVVLFPISFHMNRSPSEWSNPRILSPIVEEKRKNGEVDDTTTFANYALSERLKEVPERFFLSGYQSIKDILRLVRGWHREKNPLFHRELKIDFFSYSIGAFLTEILMIANPEYLFSRSRFFFFCGGSLFSGMNATSKFILSKTSFERIRQYYVNDFEDEILQAGKYSYLLNFSSFGKAFRAMLAPDRFESVREKALTPFSNQVQALGLKKDTVISPASIEETLGSMRRQRNKCVEEMDFDYPYSHENPFDIRLTKHKQEIDDSFEAVFEKAGNFLAYN